MPTKKLTQSTLKDDMNRLAAITSQMSEHDASDLDQLLVFYQEGMQIIEACQKRMNEVTLQVNQIQDSFQAD